MSVATADSRAMPWHDDAWGRIGAQLGTGRMPHAVLIHGPAGIGKTRLAERVASSLLCESRTRSGEACGGCHGCRLYRAEAHPDLLRVPVEKGRSAIRVDQIRALQGFVNLSSQYGRFRVVIVPQADAMNLHAANALLKTLEEPPANAVLILVSERPARLPATIRSRCQSVAVHAPDPAVAGAWLRNEAGTGAQRLLGLAGGAPLRAVSLAEAGIDARYEVLVGQLDALCSGTMSPVTAAAEWQDMERTALVELLQIALAEILRCAAAGPDALRGPRLDALLRLAAKVDCSDLQAFYELATQRRAEAEQPLNVTLMAEGLFAEWIEYTRHRTRDDHGPG
ncbi:DNA polymerase III subunit delta' [Arhodomonas sp. AD133]|uniref:DNA polymerase III subunit delta' n=1 Tax=Arhodomonas sp. AD133 TaxID=3415009 RepID=UPI003EB6AE97